MGCKGTEDKNLKFAGKRHTETVKSKDCSFRQPPVTAIDGSPRPLFKCECACGCTCLGNTEELAKQCWLDHVNAYDKMR